MKSTEILKITTDKNVWVAECINPINKKSNNKNVPLSWNNHRKSLNLILEENVLVYNVNALLTKF